MCTATPLEASRTAAVPKEISLYSGPTRWNLALLLPQLRTTFTVPDTILVGVRVEGDAGGFFVPEPLEVLDDPPSLALTDERP